MKLKEFEIYSYKLPTSLGFIREGLIVRLINELGQEGIGEIAPLPGRSTETLKETLAFTGQLRDRFLLQDFSPAFFPPSVMFGMEMALSSLLFPIKEDTPFKLYSNKLKLKDLSVSEAVDLCKMTTEPLRVDLNRKWDLAKTVKFCSHFEPSDFLYIEDPVSIFKDLEKFYDQTGFSYAIDEYLSEHPLERLLKLRGLTHLVIKPTLHGGLNRCKFIVTEAKGMKCVFSSTYETGIGLMHIARIGATINSSEPMGIDTHSIFSEQLIPFNPQETLIQKELYHNLPIAWNKLQKVI